jgi:deoxyhypusine synthase
LSGCTYSEGVSWGKFVPPEEGGRYAEVLSDATVVWPLLMVALLERARPSEKNSDRRAAGSV